MMQQKTTTTTTTMMKVRAVRRRGRGGFTLVEVMISVAMVLLLIYGVAQVFKMSSDAMGANQALSNIIRDHRAALATMSEDFRNCAADSPAFIISSRVAWVGTGSDVVDGVNVTRGVRAGYRNAADERQQANPPTILSPLMSGVMAGDRNPRLDRVSFFTRSLYRRQSGGGVQATTSNEAYVSYGHTVYQQKSASPNTSYTGVFNSNYGKTPSPDNQLQYMLLPENQYAADRILGRVCILMKHMTDPSESSTPWTGGPNNPVGSTPLWPLDWDAMPYLLGSTTQAFGDIAPYSIDEFRLRANAAYAAQVAKAPPDSYPINDSTRLPTAPKNWFRPMEDQVGSPETASKYMRFYCDPTMSRATGTSVTPAMLSRSSRYFVGRVTQFVVEYSGDYLDQDPVDGSIKGGEAGVGQLVQNGVLKPGKTDGKTDFIVDKTGGTDPKSWVRRTRWYGFPRDSNGDGRVTINDVVPFADVLHFNGITGYAPWEADLPGVQSGTDDLKKGLMNAACDSGNTDPQLKQDYASKTLTAIKISGAPSGFKYTCAWHNDAPEMIRVLIKIDDATGKLQDGQWYEYVLKR